MIISKSHCHCVDYKQSFFLRGHAISVSLAAIGPVRSISDKALVLAQDELEVNLLSEVGIES
tara:strand:- start:181 stop:366 length:186 start_codon:yes stop_codon:yes gene_type:complete